jgi:hypothetical protein
MVEITYQMVLSTLQTAGILVGIFYYIMTLRNQTTLRKSQFLYTIYDKLTNAEEIKRVYTDLIQWQWDDFEDFERKYGLDVNSDAFHQRHACFNWANFIGNLLKKDLIDHDLVYKFIPFAFPQLWNKFKPIIEEHRVRYNFGPDYHAGFEYLAKEMERIRETKAIEPTKPFAESVRY